MVRLKKDMFLKAQKLKGWNNSELARKMDIHRTLLWRVLLPETSKYHMNIGPAFIAGALRAFPELSFNDLFYIDDRLPVQTNKDINRREVAM